MKEIFLQIPRITDQIAFTTQIQMDADEDHAMMEVTGSETEDRLVSEFQSWRSENPNHGLNLGLERIEKDTDGTASLRLHLRFVFVIALLCSDVI